MIIGTPGFTRTKSGEPLSNTVYKVLVVRECCCRYDIQVSGHIGRCIWVEVSGYVRCIRTRAGLGSHQLVSDSELWRDPRLLLLKRSMPMTSLCLCL